MESAQQHQRENVGGLRQEDGVSGERVTQDGSSLGDQGVNHGNESTQDGNRLNVRHTDDFTKLATSPVDETESSSTSFDDSVDCSDDGTRYIRLKFMRRVWSSKHSKKCVKSKQEEGFGQLLRFLQVGDWNEIEKLIAEGIDIFDVGYENLNCQLFKTSPLVHACKFGHITCVKNLLSLERDKNGASVLPRFYHEAVLQAAREGHRDCFHFLIESELLKRQRSEENIYSPLLEVLKSSQFDSIPDLLDDDSMAVKLSEKWGSDLASLLLIHGCPPSCLADMIERGVDPDSPNSLGLTLLMCAVLAENVECVKFLLEQYVELNAIILKEGSLSQRIHDSVLPVGRTALMYAASLKTPECLREMLQFCFGTEINYKVINKWRALTFACYYGNPESVSMLIEAGAKVEIFDSENNSIILYAMHSGSFQCVKILLSTLSKECCIRSIQRSEHLQSCLLENVDCFRFFLEYLNLETSFILNWTGKSFLHYAAVGGYLETVRFLLQLGADVNSQDRFNCTPLYYACNYGHDKVVKLILEHKADIDHCLNKESVMAIIASNLDDGKCLKLLLDAGVDVDVTNWEGGTVFTTAMKGNGKCLEVLLESGRLLDNNKALKNLHKHAIKILKDDKFRIQLSLRSFILTINHKVFDWNWWSPVNFKKIVFAVVHAGICPGIIEYKSKKHSPLVLALQRRQKSVLKYLLANLYFYPGDYIYLCTKASSMRNCIQKNTGLLKLFDHMVCQPLTLQSWSFLTVSKAISLGGPGIERARRVDRLPAPNSIKRALKFQSCVSNICNDSWKTIDAMQPGEFVFLEKLPRGQSSLVCCQEACYYCEGLGLRPE